MNPELSSSNPVGVALVLAALCFGCRTPIESEPAMTSVEFLNPPGLHANPAFSQAVAVEGPCRTVYVGGQNAVDASGNIVGRGDVGAQTEQALANLRVALEAAGAGPEHVVKWTIYLVAGESAQAGFAAAARAWPRTASPPAVSVLQVHGLAHPDFLVEIEAVAVVPAPGAGARSGA